MKTISSLKPGQSIKISETSAGYVQAERSGDGKTLRYVRITATGFEVFRTVRF